MYNLKRPQLVYSTSFYNDWLAVAPKDTNAKCNLCKKVFKLSNMAADTLKSYADSEGHKAEIKNLQLIQSFLTNPA